MEGRRLTPAGRGKRAAAVNGVDGAGVAQEPLRPARPRWSEQRRYNCDRDDKRAGENKRGRGATVLRSRRRKDAPVGGVGDRAVWLVRRLLHACCCMCFGRQLLLAHCSQLDVFALQRGQPGARGGQHHLARRGVEVLQPRLEALQPCVQAAGTKRGAAGVQRRASRWSSAAAARAPAPPRAHVSSSAESASCSCATAPPPPAGAAPAAAAAADGPGTSACGWCCWWCCSAAARASSWPCRRATAARASGSAPPCAASSCGGRGVAITLRHLPRVHKPRWGACRSSRSAWAPTPPTPTCCSIARRLAKSTPGAPAISGCAQACRGSAEGRAKGESE